MLVFQTKRELAFEELNNLRVRDPDRLEAILRAAMGAKYEAFLAGLIGDAKDSFIAQRDSAQEAHDAIDALPDKVPAELDLPEEAQP